MKKLILIFLILSGCAKEIVEPEVDCKCGRVIQERVEVNFPGGSSQYIYGIRNDCTFNMYELRTSTKLNSYDYCMDFKW